MPRTVHWLILFLMVSRSSNFRTNAHYKVNHWVKTEFNVSYDKRITDVPTQGVGNGI